VDVEAVVSALGREPVSLLVAQEPPPRGVPDAPGIYAWWIADGTALSDVPPRPHPTLPLWLLYVGIAPSRPTSKATLRRRVLRQHLRGNLAASTFRRSLAALLWRSQGWTPRLTASGRLTFDAAENAALTAWQEDQLRLSWCAVDEPWFTESEVFRSMKAPLNVDGNAEDAFYPTMKAARAELVAAARRG
jgi:hypothetical protein